MGACSVLFQIEKAPVFPWWEGRRVSSRTPGGSKDAAPSRPKAPGLDFLAGSGSFFCRPRLMTIRLSRPSFLTPQRHGHITDRGRKSINFSVSYQGPLGL